MYDKKLNSLFQQSKAYPAKDNKSFLNKSLDEVVKEVFELGDKNSTFLFPQSKPTERNDRTALQNFDFTVKRNSDGRLNIAVYEINTLNKTNNNKLYIDKSQTIVRHENNNNKPICKEELNFFCTKIENYPSKKISSILDNLGMSIESYFGDDVISETMSNISQRIDPGEETLCRSEEQLIHPEGLWGVDGNLEYIVNDHKYKQGVRIEQCVYNNKNDKRCQMTDSFPNGYVTECKQRYISRHLLTYNADGKTIEKKLFKIPSCCQCVIRNEH
ncbi:spz.2 family protein [Megaselia abdita]